MLKYINAIAYAAMLALNGIANFAKLGGSNTGGVSEKYANIFTPAGWTFAIWGAIYGLLLIFVIAPFVKPTGSVAALQEKLGGWFMLSCLLNMAWMLTWHYNKIWASELIMLALLGTLIIMFYKFTFSSALPDSMEKGLSWGSAGLTMYFTWICIAAIANTMVLFTSLGIDGFGTLMTTLSVSMLIIASFVLSALTMSSGNWLIGVSGIWAYAGVISKQLSASKYGSMNVVAVAAIVGIIVLGVGVILSRPTELHRFSRSANHGGPTDDIRQFGKNTQFH